MITATGMRRAWGWAAGAGLLAAAVALAVGELAAALVGSGSSPVGAVGAWIIDIVPPWVKDAAIALFGTNDKVALIVCVVILVALLAALAGVLELRATPWGVVLVAVIGTVALGAAVSRAGATITWAIPSALAAAVGAIALRTLIDRLKNWRDSAEHAAPPTAAPAPPAAEPASEPLAPPAAEPAAPAPATARVELDRRRFLLAAGATAAVAALAAVASRALAGVQAASEAVRDAIRLPAAASPAPPVPPGADLGIPDLAPVITPNESFYRIDTALQVPVIDPEQWRLRITGLVDREVEIGWDELTALSLEEHAVTLTCVSNEVGGSLIGNAVWLGYPLRDLIERAAPAADADMVLSRSVDGFTASTPLEALTDPDRVALLAIGMNGAPLPLEHGFPVRMVVSGLYGYVSATKWVTELEVTRFADATAYWTTRGWSARGPIKTSSRIDVPAFGARVSPGTVTVAGVAWAQHTGVDRVEVRVDGGPWQQAALAPAISADTWVQWSWTWNADAGNHTLEVRATDADGRTQSGDYRPPAPDGSEGWHAVKVAVA